VGEGLYSIRSIMDNGDKKLLSEIHTAVARIEGHMPNLATKNDVTTKVATHERAYHMPRPSLTNGRGKALAKYGSWGTLISAVVYAILAALGYAPLP
jgi:hypothetical protein